MKKKIIF